MKGVTGFLLYEGLDRVFSTKCGKAPGQARDKAREHVSQV
jgi:hypothetical protein